MINHLNDLNICFSHLWLMRRVRWTLVSCQQWCGCCTGLSWWSESWAWWQSSVSVPTLVCSHELWVMTGRVRVCILDAEKHFLHGVAWFTLREGVRSSNAPKTWRRAVSQGTSASDLDSAGLPLEVFQDHPAGMKRTKKLEGLHIPSGQGIPWDTLERGEGRGLSILVCCHCDLDQDKWQKMDGWLKKKDRCIHSFTLVWSALRRCTMVDDICNFSRTLTGSWPWEFMLYSDKRSTSSSSLEWPVYRQVHPALFQWAFRLEIKSASGLSIKRRSTACERLGRVKLRATHLKYRHTSACVSEVNSNSSHASNSQLKGRDYAYATRLPLLGTTSDIIFQNKSL